MAEQAWEDAREEGMRLSLLVFFFVLFLVIIVVNEITVFGNLALFFLDFIFVHIDFGGTFWTTDHGVILRRVVRKVAVRAAPHRCAAYYIPWNMKSTPERGVAAGNSTAPSARTSRMVSSREYPERPVVGIGGVIIDGGRALLIRRGSEPLRGEWSIPGGTLELGETLEQGVARELFEETGIGVRVLELIEVFDRIYAEDGTIAARAQKKPRFHFVIADYLCERISGEPRAGSDVTDVAFAREDELARFHLTETATRVVKKAFAMARARQVAK